MSRPRRFPQGEQVLAYGLELLTAAGDQGILVGELGSQIAVRLGVTAIAAMSVLRRAAATQEVFRKAGTCATQPLAHRYFATAAACEAYPLGQAPDRAATRRAQYAQRREALLAERGSPLGYDKPASAPSPAKATPPVLRLEGAPIITAATKVTIAPSYVDYRYAIDPKHKGEFIKQWEYLRRPHQPEGNSK